MMANLPADRQELTRFAAALFRYADTDTFAALRGFDQVSRRGPARLVEGVRITDDLGALAERAALAAERCANTDEPAVFAPPICTFNNAGRARGEDLANGLALSVELDEGDSEAARRKLEGLLGPATVVVASGGEWTHPDTGEIFPKLHIHWRLSEPTRDQDDHQRLRQARDMACTLVGADPTGKPVVHPLRWPGSWNLKAKPAMARIVAYDDARELHLVEAVDALAAAIEAEGMQAAEMAPQSGDPTAPLFRLTGAMAMIPNPGVDVHYDDWIKYGYALFRASGGSGAGYDIWDAWSRKSDKYDAGEQEAAWKRIGAAIRGSTAPRTIGAGTVFFQAARHGWVRDTVETDSEPATPAKMEVAPIWESDDEWIEADIPPRPWVAPGFLLRGSVTLIAGAGSAGKSSLGKAWAVAGVLGVRFSRFEPVKPLRFLSYNVEDDLNEERRRLSATLRGFDRTPRDLNRQLKIVGPSDIGTLIHRDASTGRISTTAAMDALEQIIADWKPDVVALDPMVELHTAEENDNTGLRAVVAAFRSLAQRHDIAVLLFHHVRKGAVTPGDPDAIRGAGAIVGAARCVFTLCVMSDEEATSLGIPADMRKNYFRLDSAKSNYARATEAEWFERVTYVLDNGEVVPAPVPWAPPKDIVGDADYEALRAAVAAGKGRQAFTTRGGTDRSLSRLCAEFGVKTGDGVKAIMERLRADGFSMQTYEDPVNRNKVKGLRAPDGHPSFVKWIDE